MVSRGVQLVEGSAPAAARAASPIVVAVVGTDTSGSGSATDGVPTIVHNLTDAGTQFGTAGTVIDAAKMVYTNWSEDPYFIGITYDHTLTGSALTSARTAAITALRSCVSVTGRAPTYIAAAGLSRATETTYTANSNNTLLATIASEYDCIYVADAPLGNATLSSVTASGASTAARSWAGNNANNNQVTVAGRVTSATVTNGFMSSYMVGLMANIRLTQGVQETFSSQVATGVSSVLPSFTYTPRAGVANDAKTLDDAGISTIVRHRNQLVAYGGKTGYVSTDERLWYNKLQIVNQLDDEIYEIAENMIDREMTSSTVGRWATLSRIRVMSPAIARGELQEGSTVAIDTSITTNGQAGLVVTYYLYQMAELLKITRIIAG